jgi:Prokaryotic E2 family E
MSFLPEEDQEFLAENGIQYQELAENMPDASRRRGVLFPGFSFSGDLRKMNGGGSLERVEACDLLVVIPDGYATTKLDSFYTIPKLKRQDGHDPQNATVDSALFGRTWQFWSRHLDDKDWRVGVDSLQTFINYIRGELRNA